jgi:hypothetical protein
LQFSPRALTRGQTTPESDQGFAITCHTFVGTLTRAHG